MNLLELSSAINKPLEEIRKILYNDFNIIVLSDDMPLQEEITEKIISMFNPNFNNDENGYFDEDFCLEEQQVSLAYTRKLLRYCIANKYLFFIDTCSLLHQPAFFMFYKILKEQKNVLYVPYVVIEELKKILIDKKRDESLKKKAEKALQFICMEEEKGEIVFIGNEKDKRNNEHGQKVIHADRVIIEKLNFYRNDARSCLFITQDHDATVDVLKLNEWRSLESNALILVKKIGREGILEDNADDTVNPTLPID